MHWPGWFAGGFRNRPMSWNSSPCCTAPPPSWPCGPRDLRHDDAQSALRAAALRFDQRKLSDRLRVAVRATEALVYGSAGDLPAAIEACSRGLDLPLKVGDPAWVQLTCQRARWAVAMGQFRQADRDLAAMEARREDCDRAGAMVDVFRADFCDASGPAEEGLAKLEPLIPHETDAESVGDPCFALHLSLLIKCGQLDRVGRMLDEADRRKALAPPAAHVLRAHHRLALGDLAAAADHARQAIGAVAGIGPAPIAAAASAAPGRRGSRKGAAGACAGSSSPIAAPRDARRVLMQLDPDESSTPYHVEWARLHLLENNESQAAACVFAESRQ